MIQRCVKKCRWAALNTPAEIDADYIHRAASDRINLNPAEGEGGGGERGEEKGVPIRLSTMKLAVLLRRRRSPIAPRPSDVFPTWETRG